MFIYAACSTLLAFCVRLPVSIFFLRLSCVIFELPCQIPEKDLDSRPKSFEPSQVQAQESGSNQEEDETLPPSRASETDTIAVEDEDLGELQGQDRGDLETGVKKGLTKKRSRRLSGFESQDLMVDPETLPTGSHRPRAVRI